MSKSKAKAKQSLRDLSRELPSIDEASNMRWQLLRHSDTQLVISASALVEREVENFIFFRLKITDEQTIEDLTGDRGPLKTFYEKIELGKALKLYPDEMAHNLHQIRKIRNVFAHSVKILSLDHPLIAAELRKMKKTGPIIRMDEKFFEAMQQGKEPIRETFFLLCMNCQLYLIEKERRMMKNRNNAQRRRTLARMLQ